MICPEKSKELTTRLINFLAAPSYNKIKKPSTRKEGPDVSARSARMVPDAPNILNQATINGFFSQCQRKE